MTVAIQRKMLCEVVGEIDDLLRTHYEELCGHQDRKVLNPRWDQYAALEQAGMLLVLSAREGEVLVGYACFYVMPHMHYSDYTVATNDVLFLHPDHRLGTTGIRLIKQSEREAKAMGAQHIVWRSKPDTTLLKLLDRLDYQVEETAHGKPL